MQATPFNAMRKREELKAQRNLLFKRFLRNPQDTRLALKIKIIDDQIAASDETNGAGEGGGIKLNTISPKTSSAQAPRAKLQKT